jgi:NtrC-family two-component system response regulator AlgB
MRPPSELLFRAAATPASILILGESGTGKSVVARAVHERSHLGDKPFVTIACPSLSKDLFESELFGHIKGSFTGAVRDKWGKVHAANGGTLFLDEIGELPPDIQPKLLRLLQEKEYERVGETKTRTAEVRVIAATNQNLKQLVDRGEFREDLYYRLNVIAVELPPLRNRPEDLIDFAQDYLDFFRCQTGRQVTGFSQEALAWMTTYRWPGNLRELRNAIERAVILTCCEEIQRSDLPLPDSEEAGNEPDRPTFLPGGDVTASELEEEHIRRVLSRVPTLHEAAEVLGFDQTTLYRKRKKLGLD